MGGKAFHHGDDPLSTPRMSPNVYKALRDEYVSLLRTYYAKVVSPMEAPEKASYGDIDILVADPNPDTSFSVVSEALHAKRWVGTKVTKSYAVPFPGSTADYVQVDVHTCTASAYQWNYFTNSHGDLWNILGTSIRAFGLTANNIGLYLRIEEIENIDRRRAMVFLTSDPNSVLKFLGLDIERYWRPFDKANELYAYAAGMKYFKGDAYVRQDMKANDRKRMLQRPLYRRFVDEWLPQQEELGETLEASSWTRQTVFDEVMQVYQRKEAHDDMLEMWRKERAELKAKQSYNERRKANIKADVEYADAWIDASR